MLWMKGQNIHEQKYEVKMAGYENTFGENKYGTLDGYMYIREPFIVFTIVECYLNVPLSSASCPAGLQYLMK